MLSPELPHGGDMTSFKTSNKNSSNPLGIQVFKMSQLYGPHKYLTYCGLWWSVAASSIMVNIGSGNGLLPDGTKPLPEPMLTYHLSEVQWQSPEGNLTRDTSAISCWKQLENYLDKMSSKSPRVQWVNSSPPSAAYMHQWTGSALVQIMACHIFGPKPLSKPELSYCQLDH